VAGATGAGAGASKVPKPAPVKAEELPGVEDPETTLTKNISTLFDSISYMSRGNIYINGEWQLMERDRKWLRGSGTC
jgi:hypothetical protein